MMIFSEHENSGNYRRRRGCPRRERGRGPQQSERGREATDKKDPHQSSWNMNCADYPQPAAGQHRHAKTPRLSISGVRVAAGKREANRGSRRGAEAFASTRRPQPSPPRRSQWAEDSRVNAKNRDYFGKLVGSFVQIFGSRSLITIQFRGLYIKYRM